MSNNRIGSRQKIDPPPFPEDTNRVLASAVASETAVAAEADQRLQKVQAAIAADRTGRFADIKQSGSLYVTDAHECPDRTNPAGFCAYADTDEFCIFCGDPFERK